jgi:uncharacterized repeat protein (TIGR01451 family)
MYSMNSVSRLGRVVRSMLAVVSLFVATAALADSISDNAAAWLRGQQITVGPSAGAFPWTPGDSATSNTQGASALGLLRAWERSGNAADLAAAVANGDCQVNSCVSGMTYADMHHRFATHDPLFLEQLSIDSGDPQYADFVDSEFWSRLSAGSYGAAANLDAAGFANAVVSSRTGQSYPDLAAWDLSKTAIAAHLAGETAAVNAMMQGVLDSLNASDGAHTTFDVIGLTGAIWASAVTGVDLDPTTGKWAGANSTADLANMLLAYQAPSGGFIGSTALTAVDANADAQTTSFAMQALDGVDGPGYATEIQNGFAFISSLQQPSGEFLGAIGASPGDTGAVEGHGETLEAYASIQLRPLDVYVDDDFAGDTIGDSENFIHPQVNGGAAIAVVYGQNAFATIAEAVAQVQVGGTVYVAKGLYAEDLLTITQPVSIVGEQAGVDARSRIAADAQETVVVPGVAQAGLSLSSYEYPVIDISSDAVSIDGLIVDADNTSLNSGVALNGADPDVAGGIYVEGNDTHLQNLIVRNVIYAGIDGYALGGVASGGNLVRHNRFANSTRPSLWGRGVILQENFYAQVTENLFDEVRVGVQTNNNYIAAPGGFAPAISGNEIHATRTGIFHNLFYQNASTYTIAGNQFIASANAGESGEWSGLWIQSMGSAQTTTISANVVDGAAVSGMQQTVGYLLSNVTSSASSSTMIDGGSVGNVDAGVQATDATYYTGPVNDIVVRNVTFANIGLGAFYVEDTNEQTGSAKLSIGDGNTYSNVAHVLALSGAAPAVGFVDSQTGASNVLVRSARNYYSNPSSTAYTVANASINVGIGYTQSGGTVSVETGAFDENVVVNKPVTVEGQFAGTAGYDPLRDGSGESVISPVSGRAVRINADDVVFDGFTIENVNDTAISSGGNYGGGSTNVLVTNNRVIDVHGGSGLYTNGDIVSGRVYAWTISDNVFRNIDSGIGSGINLWKATGGTITRNRVQNAGFGGIQINNSISIAISDNAVINTASNGINVAASQDIVVSGNLITDANTGNDANAAGLTLYGGSSNVDMLCNTVNGGGNNGFSTSTGIPDPFSAVRVFDNALMVTSSVSHNLAQPINIGSNWYAGSAATIAGGNAAGAFVADALAANPIGSTVCNAANPATANDAVAILAYAGSPQNALVNTAFANPLSARVVDALGGAVMGANVSFSAPMSGASATLGTLSGTTDFNGVLSSTATANNLAGAYAVTASSGSLSPDASFSLSNDPIIGTVTWDDLSFVYDGNTHVATAHITEEPATSCTVTPVFGPNVGNYAVTASCSGTTYAASGTNTASITPASATLALSNLTQTFDGTAKPVTVTPTPSGVLFSVTYNGSATVPSAIGDYAVLATITDPNYSGPLAINVLHIVAAPTPDLGISITDNRNYVQLGKLLTYTIVVNNPGNTAISGATVTIDPPLPLLNTNPTWQCVQVTPGATCTPSGSGILNDASVSIPAGGGVVYLFNARVDENANLPDDLVSTLATVTAVGDTNAGNDSATDTTRLVILRDGFDPGGDGAENGSTSPNPNPSTSLTADNLQLLDLAMARVSDGRIIDLARVQGSNGEVIRIQAIRLSEHLLVRLLGDSDVSAWTQVAAATTQLALGLAENSLLLVGGAEELQLGMDSTSAQVWTLSRTQQ